MTSPNETLFLCSCEDSFKPDAKAILAGLGTAGQSPSVSNCSHLCRSEIGKLQGITGDITIACRQEEATLRAVLDEIDFTGKARFADIRNSAGWSSESASAGPKMAALLAASAIDPHPLPFLTLESQGVTMIYGRDETALEAGKRLADHLDITVLLMPGVDIVPPRLREFPIARGIIRQATGHLGAFSLNIDGFALASPSSRASLSFGVGRNGANSTCDLIIDLTGGAPLFSADTLRDGYLRADPRDPIAVERLLAKARELVGTFDKPKYVTYQPDLCAHSRSKITGCTRCLEVCPTGAITPDGDHVAIDPAICAGCGGCASVCPTGAASYALPSADYQMRKLRTLLRAYAGAGGKAPVLLFHDGEHGAALIDALARFGDGLPARVIPIEVNEVTQIGIEQIAASFAYGAAGVAVLMRAKPKHDPLPLVKTAALAAEILPSLGYDAAAMALIETDDPDALLAALRAMPAGLAPSTPASFMPMGAKRQVMMLALREWQATAPQKPERISLPKGAPFGAIEVNEENCTLCLACVSACPVSALSANPERPELKFQEDLCVQCGLCAATCPEKVITLKPQLDFTRINAAQVTLKQEDPYSCDSCGKAFGTKSTIERIKAKLTGKNWMYAGANQDRSKLIGYCEECRVSAMSSQNFDPYAGPERPRVRTSEDYFKERGEDKDV